MKKITVLVVVIGIPLGETLIRKKIRLYPNGFFLRIVSFKGFEFDKIQEATRHSTEIEYLVFFFLK